MTDKMKSAVMGLIMRLCKPFPKQSEPVAYLYNGVRLPKLPEWDRGAYPYAYITTSTVLGITYYTLNICTSMYTAIHTDYTDEWTLFAEGTVLTTKIKESATEWGAPEVYYEGKMTVCEYGSDYVMWSNHSFYGENGEEWITASVPVPVYE